MVETQKMYNYFTSQEPLTKERYTDLVRLCDYAPTEKQLENVTLPTSYSEFLELLSQYEKRQSKEEMYNQILSLCGGPTITKDELLRILYAGNKLTDEEIDGFFKMITEERGVMSVREIVDALYHED